MGLCQLAWYHNHTGPSDQQLLNQLVAAQHRTTRLMPCLLLLVMVQQVLSLVDKALLVLSRSSTVSIVLVLVNITATTASSVEVTVLLAQILFGNEVLGTTLCDLWALLWCRDIASAATLWHG